MRRRDFIKAICWCSACRPLLAHAEQAGMPIVGFLNGQSARNYTEYAAAFNRGLSEWGFSEGQNVTVEYRWAEGQASRLPELANDLVKRNVAVIVATGGSLPVARAATSTIPIVAAIGGDAVKLGLVKSINRPGGNLTGVAVFTSDLEGKRFELLNEIVPKGPTIGVLIDPKFDASDLQVQSVRAAAQSAGRNILIVGASVDADLDKAFTKLVQPRVGGLTVVGGPFFLAKRERLLALTREHAIPAIYENREFTAAGGLMSYGTNVMDVYRQVGVYTGRVLKGEKPAELPILQPTKFDTAINLKTAKALGLDVPTSILLRADEVIE
jgi:putative tryptophan/tyrosine transport system substrate-binding protein